MKLFNKNFNVVLSQDKASVIEISDISKDCMIEIESEDLFDCNGFFMFKGDAICYSVKLDLFKKLWDFPVGLLYHIGLIQKLLEFREKVFMDVENIEIDTENGELYSIYFWIKPKTQNGKLINALKDVIGVMKWLESNLESAEHHLGKEVDQVVENYCNTTLLELSENKIDK